MMVLTVCGLVLMLVLVVVSFLALAGCGSEAYSRGDFFGGMCLMNAAGEVLKLAGLVLVALLETLNGQ